MKRKHSLNQILSRTQHARPSTSALLLLTWRMVAAVALLALSAGLWRTALAETTAVAAPRSNWTHSLAVVDWSAAADQPQLATLAPLAVAAPACTTAVTDAATWMTQYNLITLGDLSTNSDVEGRTFVGRNFTNANSATFANRMSGAPCSDSTLTVVGSCSTKQ